MARYDNSIRIRALLATVSAGMLAASALAGPLEKLASDMVLIPGKNYKICKYEVTQALWEAVMGSNPSWFKGADLPVECVSWNDCQEFIGKLNEKTGGNYRLPTEEEWEYACRARDTGDKFAVTRVGRALWEYACRALVTGDYGKLADGSVGTLDEMGWYCENSGDKTHPVGQKKPNAFGLYDMHGNVLEWTSTADGDLRVSRGGGWDDRADFCSAGFRCWSYPDSRGNCLGLRLAVSQD